MSTNTQWKLPVLAAVGGAVGAAALAKCVAGRAAAPAPKADAMRLLNHTLSYGEADVARWTATDAAAWLLRKGVSVDTAALLEGHNVDGTILPHLTETLLTQMGVEKIGDRVKLLALAKEAAAPEQRQLSPVPPVNPLTVAAAERASPSVASTRSVRVQSPAESPAKKAAAARMAATAQEGAETQALLQAEMKQKAFMEQQIAEKYQEVVAGHIQSLSRVEKFVTSPEFKAAPLGQRQDQLKKVVELLSKLIAFADEIPEEYAAVLTHAIKRVYGHVKEHDAEFGEVEGSGDEPADMGKAERLRRIGELKGHLTNCEAGDLNRLMGELREVVGQIEDCNDAEELAALNDVFELLQKKNESLQRRAEELKAMKALHESQGEETEELIVAIQELLKVDFSGQTLEKQEEYLRLAVTVLSKYVNSKGSDPALCVQLGELVKNRRVEFEANKKRAGGESPKKGGAATQTEEGLAEELREIVEALKADEFEKLPLELQFQALEHAYQTIDKMDKRQLAAHLPLTSELMKLLKLRHKAATKAGADMAAANGVDLDDEEEEPEYEEAGDDDEDEDRRTAPQNEVNLLPKVFKRLQSETFTNSASQFEFNTLLWAVAQISQILSVVMPAEKFKELMHPVQQLLMLKMDETTALPLSRPFAKGEYAIQQRGEDTYAVAEYDESHPLALLPDAALKTSPVLDEGVIVCVAVDSPGGTEAMEMSHLAHMMKKATGYESVVLSGDTATAASLKNVLEEFKDQVAWVVVRSSAECAKNWAVFEDGDVSLEDIQGMVSPACGIVFDQFTECTFATATEAVRMEIDDAVAQDMSGSCAWLFDGFFSPIVAEVISEEGQTHDLHSVASQLQLHIIGTPADLDDDDDGAGEELETPDQGPIEVLADGAVDKQLPGLGVRTASPAAGNGAAIDAELPDLP
eukprot:TRINITY_DN1287_c2_g1_i1.p1 TRINITY_DN1287_c2_g1~~TRINITY_DN1287_c2_g1_i1.p1  ORF type:complete len:922 (+),score=463.38 TRINITY_DN1287_c2_g1_i1:34-2799(+)